jgi:hypothetical protein
VADVEQNYKTVPIEYTVQMTPPLILRGVVPPTEGHVPNGDIRAPEGGPHNVNTRGWIANSQRTHDRLGAWIHSVPRRGNVHRCPQRRHSRTVLQQEWMAPNGGQGPMTGMLTTRSRDLDIRSKPLPKPQKRDWNGPLAAKSDI